MRYERVLETSPCIGRMPAGRNAYAALKGIAKIAFSAAPLTRAHMTEPRSLESVRAPVTGLKVIAGLSRASVFAQPLGSASVTRRDWSYLIPAELTPRRKKQAAAPYSSASARPKSKRALSET